MTRLTYLPLLLLVVACSWAEEPDSKPVDEAVLQALPKVPTLATIIGDGSPKTRPAQWVQELMKKKEIKARVEIVQLKQKLIAEQETQDTEDKERSRRKLMYDKAHGTLFDTQPVAEQRKKTIRMRLEFQVPEVEMYRRLIDVYKIRSALATSVVDALTKLDRNNDGKLAADEYRDAAYIFFTTQRLFSSIDNDSDGYITVAEIDAAKNLPLNAAAAMAAGANTKDAASSTTLLIKGFDLDKDGVLTINERKALSSAYLDVALKAQQEAAAYQKLMDDLETARQATAVKFENLTIEVVETK